MKNKVVCITDEWINKNNEPYPLPKKGEIYTIDGIDKEGKNPPYFYLKEFTWIACNGDRASFSHKAFREVDSSFGQYCEDIYLSIAQFEEAMKEMTI